MKILICSLTYPLRNGVTVSINTSVDELLKRKNKVIIVSPDYKKGKFRPEHFPVPSSILARSIGILIGKEERTFSINAPTKIKKIIDDFQPDAYWLHTLSFAPNAFERQMLKSEKPKVITYHTMVEEYGKIYAGKLGALTMRKRSKDVCNKMDAIITPSSVMKKKLLEYGVIKPIKVIPTGIEMPKTHVRKSELRKQYKIPETAKILLFVGRISKEKNIDALLRLIRNLEEKDYNAFLLLIGPGITKEIKENAEKMGISNKVIFAGGMPKNDTQRIYGACDAFVFASQTETQGLVIGEAMLAKVPIIALDSPIRKEVYPRGTAAVAFQESELPKILIDTLENPEKKEKMIRKAKNFVSKNFSKKLMIDRQIRVFKKLV